MISQTKIDIKIVIFLIIFALIVGTKFTNNEVKNVYQETIIKNVDYSNRPSFCSPNGYYIKKIRGEIRVLYKFDNTIESPRTFDTKKIAQDYINEIANLSNERWLRTSGEFF